MCIGRDTSSGASAPGPRRACQIVGILRTPLPTAFNPMTATPAFRTRYATTAEALADGWRKVNRQDKDVSGGNCRGYEYQSPDGQYSTMITFSHEKNKMGLTPSGANMFRA